VLREGLLYNFRVDVFLNPEARLDLEALCVLNSSGSPWGLLLGHMRGHRFIVEKAYPSGGAAFPSIEKIEKMNALWEGRILGFFSVRPDASFKNALLDPAFFGKIFCDVRPSRTGLRIRPFIVEYKKKFYYSPIPLEPGPRGG
jgi:hypothetical protein